MHWSPLRQPAAWLKNKQMRRFEMGSIPTPPPPPPPRPRPLHSKSPRPPRPAYTIQSRNQLLLNGVSANFRYGWIGPLPPAGFVNSKAAGIDRPIGTGLHANSKCYEIAPEADAEQSYTISCSPTTTVQLYHAQARDGSH